MSEIDGELLRALDSISSTTWSGEVFRHTSRGRDPLDGRGAVIHGGRWNPPDLFPAIYFASTAETCAEEFRRMATGQAAGPTSFLPRDLHRVRVRDLQIIDLTAEATREAIGVSISDLASDDWSICQRIGAAAHFLLHQGIRSPSATGTGEVITVFQGRIRPVQLELIETTELQPLLEALGIV